MVLRKSTFNLPQETTIYHHTNPIQSAPCPLRLTEMRATTTGALRPPTITNALGGRATSCCFNSKDTYAGASHQRLVGENRGNNQSTIKQKQATNEFIMTRSENSRSRNTLNRFGSLVSQSEGKNVINVDFNKRPIVYRHYHGFEFIALAFVIVVVVFMLTSKSIEGSPDTPLNHTATLCPLVKDCHCKWSNGKQGASCERRKLKTIPMQLPNTTLVLDMSENNLVHLPQHIFQDRRLTNLQKLYLTECQLSYIADEAFAHLTNLVELDLSHNYLQQVPTKSLEPLQHSLRKLLLSHNMIHILDSRAFASLSSLTNLDISNNQLSQIESNAFQGLGELRELKLSENRLSQLPLNVVGDFREFLILDLYGNPWHCDCELRQTIDWMNRRHVQQSINPTCATPLSHKDIRWQSVKPEEFLCPPVIVNKQNEMIVGAGSNVTLACVARGSAPFTFVWFQDEKNLTGRSNSNNSSDPPPSTKLLEEKRYEIAEDLSVPNVTTSILYLINLRLTDTSMFLCWVENRAGYALGNFSLIVTDSPPAPFNGGGNALDDLTNSFMRFMRLDSGDASTTQITIVTIGFILLLLAPIVCLIVFRHVLVSRRRPIKSSSPADFKAQPANGKLSSANKFAKPGDGGAHKLAKSNSSNMFASSDEDGATEEDDEDQSSSVASSSIASGSSSSCRKSGNHHKVMAVNDLDGFIEHMRSGIINMDYHTMSPVDQFNNAPKNSSHLNQQQLHQQQQHQNYQPLAHLNHFPTSSNASSQPLFYTGGGNGSNSMATTLSDLSPSSGSASTSFANNPNNNTNLIGPTGNTISRQQQQFIAAANMAAALPSSGTMRRQLVAQPMTNCDPQAQQNQRLLIDGDQHTIPAVGYADSFSEEQQLISAARNQMPPFYDPHHHQHLAGGFDPQLYDQMQQQQQQQTHLNSSRPNSMIGQSYQPQQQQRYHPMQDASGFQIL